LQAHSLWLSFEKTILVVSRFIEFSHSLGHSASDKGGCRSISAVPRNPDISPKIGFRRYLPTGDIS
jgi:hypothetical protein